MNRAGWPGPVELGHLEGRRQGRVGDALARRRIAEFGVLRKLATPPFAHSIRQTRLEIAEEQKRRRARPFLAHEQERNLRRQQNDRDASVQRWLGSSGRQPGSAWLVADMVVVLQECDQSRRRQRRRGFAAGFAATKRRGFALIRETLGQRPAEMGNWPDRIVSVKAN